MPDLKTFVRSFPFIKDKKSSLSGKSNQLIEIPTKPKSFFQFGRHLSFSLTKTSIQMAAVSHIFYKVKLIDASKIYIPKSLNTDEKRNSFINNQVSSYIKEFGGIFPKISIALTGKSTAFRTFLMPSINKKELKSAIGFEISNQVPFPAEDCIYDFKITSKIISQSKSQNKIALYASTKQNISKILKSFKDTKTDTYKIFHTQDVLGLLLLHLSDFQKDKTYTVLNITRGLIEVSFFNGHQLQFYYNNNITSAFQGNFLDPTKFDFFAESTIDLINISYDYFSGQYSGVATNEIYVYGDLSYSKELLDALGKNSNFTFKKFPINKIGFLNNLNEILQESLPACLPVVASASCQFESINLIPPKLSAKRKEASKTLYSKLTFATAVIAMLLSWVILHNSIIHETNHLDETNQQIDKFKNSEAIHTYNNLKKQILMSRSYFDKIKNEPSYLNYNLKELSLLTPDKIKLIHLDFKPKEQNQNMLIQGVVVSKKIPPEIILAEYTASLTSSPFYYDVKIIKHIKKTVDDHFEIEFVIQMRGVA